jgi:ArsR family transcriptional regulator, zinc-responsive transcriptional repressor
LAGAADLLKALASVVRLATVLELSEAPRCVHELQTSLEASGRAVSQPLLSQHLKVLRDAGLVTSTRRGTEITYQLADAHVGHIVNDAIRHSQEEHL